MHVFRPQFSSFSSDLSWWLFFWIRAQTLLFSSSLSVIYSTMTALENEVLRNPKPSLVDRSVLELGTDKLLPPDIYMDRVLLRPRVGYEDVCDAGGPPRQHNSPSWDYSTSDMELMEKDKARILELQEEAEVMEEAYRSYQQRAAHATVPLTLPPKTLSPPQAYRSHSPNFSHRKRDSPRSHIHATHKQKMRLKPLSPPLVQSPTSISHDAQTHFLSAQPGVNPNQPQATVNSDFYSHHFLAESLSPRGVKTQNGSSDSSEQLSCATQSMSRRKHQEKNAEGIKTLCFNWAFELL